MSRLPSVFDFDCVIIGAGPAGLTAAIYLRRFNRNCLLVAGGKPRAAWIPKTRNLIGHPDGITGKNLLKKMNRHADGLKIPRATGTGVAYRMKNGFKVKIGHKTVTTRTVIFATGFTDHQPKLKNLQHLRTSGFLRYCPVCDAYEHRDQEIAVFLKNEEGIDKALFMYRFTKKIRLIGIEKFTIPHTRHPTLQKLGVTWDDCAVVQRVSISGSPRGLNIKLAGKPGFFVKAAYVELGCQVNDSAFRHLRKLRKSPAGLLITTSEQRLTIPGLFAIGDCVNNLGQIAVAAGQAAIAATAIHEDLSTN